MSSVLRSGVESGGFLVGGLKNGNLGGWGRRSAQKLLLLSGIGGGGENGGKEEGRAIDARWLTQHKVSWQPLSRKHR